MIDLLVILNRHGYILWVKEFIAIQGKPLNFFVTQVLLKEKTGLKQIAYQDYGVRWAMINEHQLIVACVFQRALVPSYVDTLLNTIKVSLTHKYGEWRSAVEGRGTGKGEKEGMHAGDGDGDGDENGGGHSGSELDELEEFFLGYGKTIEKIHAKVEDEAEKALQARKAGPRKFEETQAAKKLGKKKSAAGGVEEDEAGEQGAIGSNKSKKSKKKSAAAVAAGNGSNKDNQTVKENSNKVTADTNADDLISEVSQKQDQDQANGADAQAADNEAKIRENIARMKALRGGKKSTGLNRKAMPAVVMMGEDGSDARDVEGGGKKEKVYRESKKNQLDEEELQALDFSKRDELEAAELEQLEAARNKFLNAEPNNAYDIISRSDDEDDENFIGYKTNEKNISSAFGGVFSFFQGLAGQKNLTKQDLEPVLASFKTSLMEKNVAQNIAESLCDSVGVSLEGKKMESLSTVTKTVKKSLDEALTRILTPKQSTEILLDIDTIVQNEKRPFVVVFCGVNGVGKSTSLAKICYYLQHHGKKVLIAACDTFRAGAVEQLRTHSRCLNVELFEKGYGKDAAAIANEAIKRAKEIKADVVLVDTAGRMQDNEPLMRSLAKLVTVNQPDRVFFVGEALVGNDAVDQLTKFNQALIDHQPGVSPQTINGIVLTKFDTIDDKVGAAVSMVYTTGQPIVFVGVGQTYMDLRKVNTSVLVKALLH